MVSKAGEDKSEWMIQVVVEQWNADGVLYANGVPATADTLQTPALTAKSEIDYINSKLNLVFGDESDTYDSVLTYNIDHIVTYAGILYKCLQDGVSNV